MAVRKDFGLTYRDKDNSNKTPLCIHRAPLGTHERFIGFLIEHYAGNFPLWLAPDQVRVITLNDDEALINYAKPIVAELRANMVRQVLIESGINYVEVANEAAFYGPKIDVQVWSAIGREFTIATNQVDFAVPAGGRPQGLRPDLPRQGQLEQDAVVHPSRAARHA